MVDIPAHLAAAIAERGDVAPPPDKLDRVRAMVVRHRDLTALLSDLKARAEEVQAALTRLETRELVDLFNEAGVPGFSLEAEGNLPPVTLNKQPFYSAKIPEAREAEAFTWLETEGHGDLIKSTITLSFGMGERKLAKKLEDWLTKQKLAYASKVSVHPGTLLAFVKRQFKEGKELPMDVLGVYVGEIVKIAPMKEKK